MLPTIISKHCLLLTVTRRLVLHPRLENYLSTLKKTHTYKQIWRSTDCLKVAEHSCARFADSVSDAIKRALGLWYANTAVDKVIPQFDMK